MLDKSRHLTDVAVVFSPPVERFKWTDDKVEIVRSMWVDGKSASEIAEQIPGTTRLAVCGKLDRLGLKRAGAPVHGVRSSDCAKARRLERNRVRRLAAQLGQPVVGSSVRTDPRPEPPPSSGEMTPTNLEQLFPAILRRSFNELGPRHCRYPVGDPSHGGFFFCGAERIRNSSYCARCTAWCSPLRVPADG